MQWITFYFNSRWHKYIVERLPDEKMRECWKVIAGNGDIDPFE
jgi:hypothetical protein